MQSITLHTLNSLTKHHMESRHYIALHYTTLHSELHHMMKPNTCTTSHNIYTIYRRKYHMTKDHYITLPLFQNNAVKYIHTIHAVIYLLLRYLTLSYITFSVLTSLLPLALPWNVYTYTYISIYISIYIYIVNEYIYIYVYLCICVFVKITIYTHICLYLKGI